MGKAGADVDLTVLASLPASREPFIRPTFPNTGSRFLLGALAPAARWVAGRVYRGRVEAGDVAYFWLESPPALVESVQRKGAIAVREMVNCTAAFRHEQFERAYALLGWPSPKLDHASMVAREREELLACDAVFCPSPFVLESVVAYGVRSSACLLGSYGWSGQRFRPHPHRPVPHRGLNVLFVGSVGVRKGAPWLLEAWREARVDGTLILAGGVDQELGGRMWSLLGAPSVRVLGDVDVDEVAELYDRADLFVLPTWEEGAPLVVFEAMAHGLPSIVSPFGGAGVVTAEEGVIVEPGSVDALVAALRRLAADKDARYQLGDAAFETAKRYEWARSGERRLGVLMDVLSRPRAPSAPARI